MSRHPPKGDAHPILGYFNFSPIIYGMSALINEFRTQAKAEFRKPVLTLVEMSWQSPDRTWQAAPARMEDKSAGGACIRSKVPLVAGARLKIKSRHENFSGTARYCRSDGGEYLVGIQRDPANSPLRDRPEPMVVPPRKRVSGDSRTSAVSASTIKIQEVNIPPTSVPPGNVPPLTVTAVEVAATEVPTVEIQSPPEPPESKLNQDPTVGQKAENDPVLPTASPVSTPPAELDHEVRKEHEIGKEEYPRSRPADLASIPPADPPPKPPVEPPVEPPTELQTKQLSKQVDEGRKHMRDKWLELPWHKNNGASGPEDGEPGSNGNSAKENPMHDLTQPTQKAPARSAREVPTFQVDLSPVEDIYRAAGIMDPCKGYSIIKVVEMLHSAHIRDLSKEIKRSAVLMALETAGIPIDQIQRDAKARQDALDSHEALQRKHVEAEWERKAAEVVQIQAELESIKAHYMARISQNIAGVAREKETFSNWLTLKQQGCQSMADAVELLKSPASAPAAAPPDARMSISGPQVSAKTV